MGPSFQGWAPVVSAQSFQLPFWTWIVYIVAVSAAALWKGGLSERIGAGIIFGSWVASTLVWRLPWGSAANEVAMVDLVQFLGLTALALRSPRYWPLFAAGFQLLTMITYWAHVLDPTLGGWVYLTAGILWGYLVVGALAVGTFNAWRRRGQPAMAAAPMPAAGDTRR